MGARSGPLAISGFMKIPGTEKRLTTKVFWLSYTAPPLRGWSRGLLGGNPDLTVRGDRLSERQPQVTKFGENLNWKMARRCAQNR
jgi:hypothetical protein